MSTPNAEPYDGDDQGFSSLYAIQRRARAVSLDDFVAKFPHPALVPDVTHLETNEDDSNDEASGVQLLTVRVGGMGVLRYLNKIAFLRKRPGNPYAHLVSVGRSASNDLVIALDTVSKVHGYFTRDNEHWLFTDRGSTNGSSCNDQPIEASQPVRLRDGDRLTLGSDVTLDFKHPQSLHRYLVNK